MTARGRFKQSDLTRAVAGAVKAGLKPCECVIDPTGAIRLVFAEGVAAARVNPLDRLLDR